MFLNTVLQDLVIESNNEEVGAVSLFSHSSRKKREGNSNLTVFSFVSVVNGMECCVWNTGKLKEN